MCERDLASAPGLAGVATSSGEGVPLSGIAAGRDAAEALDLISPPPSSRLLCVSLCVPLGV